MEKQKKRPTKVNKDTFPLFSPPITTKPAKSWTAVILMVPVMGMIYAEIYNQVSLNFATESYQSGWHFVAVFMLTPFIYVVSGVTVLAGYFFKNIKMNGLELFFKSSLILTALPWVLWIIITMISYLQN